MSDTVPQRGSKASTSAPQIEREVAEASEADVTDGTSADAEPSPEAGSLPSEHMLTLQSEQIESCWECGQRDQGEYENSNRRFYCNACWIDYRTHQGGSWMENGEIDSVCKGAKP